MEGNGVHASFPCCCAQDFQLPDTGWLAFHCGLGPGLQGAPIDKLSGWATSNVSTQRRTSVVPRSAFSLRSDFSQEKPNGNSLDLTGLGPSVKTRERRGSSFSQLGLEPNHTGLTAQSLFFLEESCRVKRSDTQTSSNFSNYFKRVLKLQKRSSSFAK